MTPRCPIWRAPWPAHDSHGTGSRAIPEDAREALQAAVAVKWTPVSRQQVHEFKQRPGPEAAGRTVRGLRLAPLVGEAGKVLQLHDIEQRLRKLAGVQAPKRGGTRVSRFGPDRSLGGAP
jgi:hypothetical protein